MVGKEGVKNISKILLQVMMQHKIQLMFLDQVAVFSIEVVRDIDIGLAPELCQGLEDRPVAASH